EVARRAATVRRLQPDHATPTIACRHAKGVHARIEREGLVEEYSSRKRWHRESPHAAAQHVWQHQELVAAAHYRTVGCSKEPKINGECVAQVALIRKPKEEEHRPCEGQVVDL